MSKSVLVIDTPENCYGCPFGTEYCGNLEYEGCCELAECLDGEMRLIEEKHYDYENESRPDWCPLKLLPEKMKVTGLYNGEYFKAGGKPPSYKIGWNACIDAITGGDYDD
jgi:hypothetical protein